MPLLLFVLFGIAGVVTFLKMKANEAQTKEDSSHAPGAKYSLNHPTTAQAPKLADGTGDTAAPPSIVRSFAGLFSTQALVGSHDPMIPIGGYDVQLSEDVEARVEALGHAIAKAEGFGIPGTLPTRAKNPGDMKLGDEGHGLIGGKTVFATAQDGWNALFNQIKLIIAGKSHYYTVDNTFEQFARTYTGGDSWQSWAATVTAELRVSQSSTLRSYLGV